jgi:3-hydroxybutyryl-CoA dehydrogenase
VFVDVKKLCILGIGNIGYQIAQLTAQHGYKVTLRDLEEKILQDGSQKIRDGLRRFFVDKGKLTQEEADAAFTRISFTTDLKEAAKDADLVIESVPENMKLKQQVFKELDEICPPRTILTSNSSALAVTEISALAKRKDKVAGLHFSNPPSVLNLLEIRRCLNTSDETINTLKDVGAKLDQEMIVVKDYPGGLARLLNVQMNEAFKLIEAGVCTPEDIDKVTTKALGHRWGLMQVVDNTLEVPYAVLSYLQQEFGDAYAPAPLLKQMILSGRTGKSAGRGFYDYSK